MTSVPAAITVVRHDGNIKTMAAVEKELILAALVLYRGHVSDAAYYLGLGRSTLYRKMEEFGISIQKEPEGGRVKRTVVA